jgi:hypothetical protein
VSGVAVSGLSELVRLVLIWLVLIRRALAGGSAADSWVPCGWVSLTETTPAACNGPQPGLDLKLPEQASQPAGQQAAERAG